MKLFRAGRDFSRWITVKLLQTSHLAVGTVSWRPPAWPARVRSLCNGPLGWTLLFLIVCMAGVAVFRAWKEMQPVPEIVVSLVRRPALPPLSEKPTEPQSLAIDFSKAAAPLDAVNKPVIGIEMSPKVDGKWRWSGDRRLLFQPVKYWPADTEFTVIVPEQVFIKDLPLNRRDFRFRTLPFQASITSLEIKIDPRNEERREILGAIEFSHPVDPVKLRETITAETLGGSPLFDGSNRSRSISIQMFRQGRLAYVNAGTVTLPAQDDFVKLDLGKSLRTAGGEASLKEGTSLNVKVASAENFFQIESLSYQMVRTEEGVPQQIVIVKTSNDAKSGALDKHIAATLLPPPPSEDREEEEAHEERLLPLPQPKRWNSLSAIPQDVLFKGEKITLHPLRSEHELTRLHSYRVNVPPGGNLLLTVGAGAKGYGGYTLKEEYSGYLYLSGVPAEIDILGRGAILALPGEKKISIKTRRLQDVRVQICRIFPDELNHLVSQTRGDFGHPSFENWEFSEDNISVIGERFLAVNGQNDAEARYVSFDFKDELAKVEPRLSGGLFILRMTGYDRSIERQMGVSVRRFVLVTDLGIVAKKNADESRSIFLQSLARGEAIAGAEVTILSKNGEPLVTATSDEKGCAAIPSVAEAKREKEPVAIMVRKGDDISFLPFGREDRVVDVSNFDTDGITLARPEDLQAFGFTERGVYRPGEVVHLGMLVKRRDWASLPPGLPVSLEILDSRGKVAFLEKRNLEALSMLDFTFETSPVSPTGTYQYELFVGDGIKERNVLFTETFRVEDFQPDRMKIEAALAPAVRRGWMQRDELAVSVKLQHLFGASAAGCEVKGIITGIPWTPNFAEYSDWSFTVRGARPESPFNWKEEFSTMTDVDGAAHANPTFAGFPDVGLTVTADINGYEPDGGRSVAVRKSVAVAPFDYLVGWRCSQDLDFLTKDLACELELLAVNGDLTPIALEGLRTRITSIQNVSALIQTESGSFQYRSVPKESVVSEEPLTLQPENNRISLPTNEAGYFRVEIVNSMAETVLRREFHVAGKGDSSVGLEKSAEMESTLSNDKPQPGETITLSLKTPYTGAGLITIERENVVSHQWFQTNTTSSVHSIRIPDSFEGTGYITVSMLRSLDSEEIFASPHSHCVVPIEVIPTQRKLGLSLSAPGKVKPGEKLNIRVSANRRCKAIVFAVDEGILQVSDYATPDPIASFFEKRALLVETSQILDQLLPEFSMLAKQSAFGGDGEEKLAKNLNPFTRVTEKPVLYWSGVLEINGEANCVYEVPDYFDGSLRLMAVALAPDGSDATEAMTKVAGPFVLQPSAPLAAAPGDEMVATVHVTRLIDDFPADAPTEVICESGDHLKVLDDKQRSLTLKPGEGKVVTFRMQVLDRLGSAELRFTASGGGHTSMRKRTLSIRPIVPYATVVRSGSFAKSLGLDLNPNYRPEYLKRKVALSRTPMSMAVGLSEYLAEFPHGCTEQITSKAFCRLILSGEQSVGLTREVAAKQIAAALQILRGRQANSGAFGLWDAPEEEPKADWLSCYVIDFLLEAKAARFEVPEDLLTRANKHLDKVAAADPRDLDEARAMAYAIYLLTKQGVVTTNLLLHLRDRLAADVSIAWQGDLTALYIAGTHALLLQRNEAKVVFEQFQKIAKKPVTDFFNRLVSQSVYLTMIARHSPELLKNNGEAALNGVLGEIEGGRFNTISGAYAVQALRAYSGALADTTGSLGIDVWSSANKPLRFSPSGLVLQQGMLPVEAHRLGFKLESEAPGKAYYQVIESGFERAPRSYSNGLEIIRVLSAGAVEMPKSVALGESLTVTVRMRSTSGKALQNVAIIDLLPAGFELGAYEVVPGARSNGFDYVDVREDRILWYGDVGTNYREVTYHLTPICQGRYQVPPVAASSMYDLQVSAMSEVQSIEVVGAK